MRIFIWGQFHCRKTIHSTKDDGDVDANRLNTAVAEIRASDHSKVSLTADETIYIGSQDHAQVSWQGTAGLDEEREVSQQ